MTLFMVTLLVIGTWLDVTHPRCHEEDTMKYKLKYVRLRPIHEEERKRVQGRWSAAEADSMEVSLKRILLTSAR
jgi:hypothetical protein